MLYQNKQNEVFNISDLRESIEKAEKQGLIKLTDKQIKAYDNKPEFGVWNGNEWIKDVEKCEEQRIQQTESKCNQAIESVYPIYKQINITNLLNPYTEQDRDIMKAFIDSKRAICHKAITDGTNPEDVDFSNES